SRGRGLKPLHPGSSLFHRGRRPFAGAWIETSAAVGVAGWKCGRPFAGAWIETQRPPARGASAVRRPFAGAWIETISDRPQRRRAWVAPSRGRGLKPSRTIPSDGERGCRPFAGAWIETLYKVCRDRTMSRVAPSRGRGLKRAVVVIRPSHPYVAPSRGRGLKLHQVVCLITTPSRPFAGAWIE